jgi:hypothetical protein
VKRIYLWHTLLVGVFISTFSALVYLAAMRAAEAQILGDQITGQVDDAPLSRGSPVQGKFEKKNLIATVVPLPIIDPTLGEGLAAVGLITFKLDRDDTESPRSTVVLAYARTNRENEVLGVGGSFYFEKDRYRAKAIAGNAGLNIDFYGLSDRLDGAKSVPFALDGRFARIGGAVRLFPNSYVGLHGIYADVDFRVRSNGEILGSSGFEIELHGFGLSAEYDTRNSNWFPTSGTVALLEVTAYDESRVGIGGFEVYETKITHYAGIDDSLIFAGNVRFGHASDVTPFFLLPFVQVRGFPAFRYLDRTVVQAQSELRWFPFERDSGFVRDFGFVAFAGAGIAAPDFGSLQDRPFAYAGGVGLRYRVSEQDGINVGLDLAWGRGSGTSVYFRIGEAF